MVLGKGADDGAIEYMMNDSRAAAELLEKYGIKPGKDPSRQALELLNGLLGAASIDVKSPLLVGFCYSIVVNNSGTHPYGEIGVLERDAMTGKQRAYKKQVPVKVVEVPDDITFSREQLEQEISEKIRFPRISWWGRKTYAHATDSGNYGKGTGYFSQRKAPPDAEPPVEPVQWEEEDIEKLIASSQGSRSANWEEPKDINETVEDFSRNALEYVCGKSEGLHKNWLAWTLYGFSKGIGKSLSDAAAEVGMPNCQLNLFFCDDTREAISTRILSCGYSSGELEFMERFNEPGKRADAISEYANTAVSVRGNGGAE
jgi:hypothetical protein